jgi:transketolase N-terminal domain/subunit
MHSYKIENEVDVYIYLGDQEVMHELNWESAEAAQEWASAMVIQLNAENKV